MAKLNETPKDFEEIPEVEVEAAETEKPAFRFGGGKKGGGDFKKHDMSLLTVTRLPDMSSDNPRIKKEVIEAGLTDLYRDDAARKLMTALSWQMADVVQPIMEAAKANNLIGFQNDVDKSTGDIKQKADRAVITVRPATMWDAESKKNVPRLDGEGKQMYDIQATLDFSDKKAATSRLVMYGRQADNGVQLSASRVEVSKQVAHQGSTFTAWVALNGAEKHGVENPESKVDPRIAQFRDLPEFKAAMPEDIRSQQLIAVAQLMNESLAECGTHPATRKVRDEKGNVVKDKKGNDKVEAIIDEETGEQKQANNVSVKVDFPSSFVGKDGNRHQFDGSLTLTDFALRDTQLRIYPRIDEEGGLTVDFATVKFTTENGERKPQKTDLDLESAADPMQSLGEAMENVGFSADTISAALTAVANALDIDTINEKVTERKQAKAAEASGKEIG